MGSTMYEKTNSTISRYSSSSKEEKEEGGVVQKIAKRSDRDFERDTLILQIGGRRNNNLVVV
ncbi:MAG: hypothetical protein AAB907_03245 [Patescibacteria group bacterium]